jgi:hypothetical protein
MSNNDEWVSVNGHLDHGTGFIHAGIADDIEQRFGVFPSFGYAGGCVNMVLRLETGHIVNVTDAEKPLTPIGEHTAADGFAVAIYRDDDAFGYGHDPVITRTAHISASGLVDLIADAINALT